MMMMEMQIEARPRFLAAARDENGLQDSTGGEV
jgi:hypothetical protein